MVHDGKPFMVNYFRVHERYSTQITYKTLAGATRRFEKEAASKKNLVVELYTYDAGIRTYDKIREHSAVDSMDEI